MKWHTHYFELELVKQKMNFIAFEQKEQQREFLQLLQKWIKNESMDYPYFLCTENEYTLTAKDMNILVYDGSELVQFHKKEDNKLLYQRWEYELESNEDLLRKYEELQQYLIRILPTLSITCENIDIDWYVESIPFEQLTKFGNVELRSVTSKEDIIPTIDYREFLFRSWLKLQNNSKPSICMYFFPENELTDVQIEYLANLAETMACTLICLTTTPFLTENMVAQQVHFIKQTGRRYQLEQLEAELASFFSPELLSKRLLIRLAQCDIKKDFLAVDEKWVHFLNSNEF